MSTTAFEMINASYLSEVIGSTGDGTLNSIDLIEAALSEIRLAKALLSEAQREAVQRDYHASKIEDEG